MNSKFRLLSILLIIVTFTFASCASTKSAEYDYGSDGNYTDDETTEILEEETLAPVITDDFIGDFSPVQIKNEMCLLKVSKNMKPKELNKNYIIPTTNTVEIHFRDTINQIALMFNKAERDKITAAANQFLEEYETKTIKRGKITKKNGYFSSKAPCYFGLTGYNNGTDYCDYYTIAEIYEKRAYFLIYFVPSRCDEGSGFTPKICLYFSPSQLKDFLEIFDQEYLISEVQDLRTKGYTY